MKKTLMILFVALFAVSCASVFAAENPKSTGKVRPTHLMGEVVAVDAANNVFVVRETLKDKSTKEITITCEPNTKILMAGKTVTLNEMTAGDTVTVAYNPAAEGKNMAKTISIVKPQRKEETPSKS